MIIKDNKGNDAFSISTRLNDLIKRIKEKIHKDDAMVLGIAWGDVGSGKSLTMQQWGYAIDPTLDISRVCFDKEEFINAVLDSKKGQVIIGDEGIALFFSRGSMTKEGRLMAELMAQIRAKNLCILICVPELLSVDWLVLKAANFVAYVWEGKKMINGRSVTMKSNVALYPNITGADSKTKIIHYLKSKRSNPQRHITRPIPYLTESGKPIGDTFKKPFYPAGELEYRKKKEAVLEKYRGKDLKPKEKRTTKVDMKLMDTLLRAGYLHRVIAEKCNCAVQTVHNRASLLKITSEKSAIPLEK